ncbi:MAG: ATP-binding cassette domain-containing protein [Chthoniobacterales bacterium]|nr:ATP-binding cassette domain-containing protein [Chthoniobacterales bacterium]
MANVTVKNLSKSFPGQEASGRSSVSDVSFEIVDGEFAVLIGTPGSGKTTVLRTIAGLEDTSRGDIFIGGRRVNDVSPKDRDIAMVFRDSALYPHMSVYDNIAFGLKRRKFGETEIRKRVEDAASILAIEKLLHQKPPVLPAGDRMRVALARAIVRQPKVFLFDDPLGDLDVKTRAEIRADIARLHQRLEATMIYVTPDQTEAMTMGDRLVVMDRGVVQQSDTPQAVYHTPANVFVAGLIGSPPMNFIHGKLKQEREALVFSESDGGTIESRFNAADRPEARSFVGKAVIFGIRPQAVRPVQQADGKGSVRTSFPALIDIVAPMGAETDLSVQTGAHKIVCRSSAVAESSSQAGRRVRFEIDVAAAHLFDPDSTRRIA